MAELLDEPIRAELRALYAETDALLAESRCELTGDCCRFAVTGREPYPTPVELARVFEAIQKKGITLAAPKKKRALPLVDDVGRCPLLGQDGACRIYADRPFGCRTYFCDLRVGPPKLPRKEIILLGRRVADLAAKAFPRDPRPRPLVAALEAGPKSLRR